MPLINIVRRPEQAKALQEIGAENIVDSSSKTFDQDLEALIEKIKPTSYFSCVGGQTSYDHLKKMPRGSKLYYFSDISSTPVTFYPRELILSKKSINSVFMPDFLMDISESELNIYKHIISTDLNSTIPGDGKVFESNIVKTFPLKEFEKAMEYSKTVRSEGKVLLDLTGI
jgi:NADPH:quinone reductase